MCIDCFSCDRHALKDGTGIGRKKDTVLVCSRLSLICITDNVFHISRCAVGKLQFPVSREAGSSPAAESCMFQFFNDLFPIHVKGSFQALIAACCDIFSGIFRIDLSSVSQKDSFFFHHSTSSLI